MSAAVRESPGAHAPVAAGDSATDAQRTSDLTATTIPRFWNRLSQPVPDALPVSRDGPRVLNEHEFRLRIATWRATIAALPNSAVALFEPDGFEFAAALIGSWYAGKTVYIPGDTQSETCRALATHSVAFVGAFPDEHAPVRSASGELREPEFRPLNAHDATAIIFTSGSTGAPQAVPKRLTQLLAEVETLHEQFGNALNEGDIVISTVSHQHIYGLLFKILWPLNRRKPFESGSVLYPEQLAAQLAVQRSIVVSGPAHLKRLPASLDWTAARANVRAVFSSGGPLPTDAVSHTEQLLAVAPIEVYGSSETGGIAWRQRTGGADAPWTPLPGVEVREQDARLAVRSAHLPNGEWFLVEDHAEFDAGGRFTLKGRADRLAKIEGKRVSLVAMEEALLGTGLVAEARLLQLESSRDEIGAVIVLADAGWTVLRAHNIAELRRLLNDALRGSVERIAHPRRWRWVDALPVNAAGKTTNAAAAALFDAGGLTLPAVHVLHATNTEVRAELYVSARLPVFDGHFREIPVLPGVAQVDWAVFFGRKLFGVTAQFQRMEAVKFHRVYQPGALLSLSMQWNAERRMIAFRFESSSSTHSSGRIFFAE